MEIKINTKLPLASDYEKQKTQRNFWNVSYNVPATYCEEQDELGNPIIVKFICEDESEYSSRKKLTSPINFCNNIINKYNSAVFKGEVYRAVDNPFMDTFLNNCDLKGTSFNSFMKKALKVAQIEGMAYILIDSTSASDNIYISQAQKRQNNIRTYVRQIKADTILNQETYESGNLKSILIAFSDFVRYYDEQVYIDIKTDKNFVVTSVSEPKPHGYSTIPVVLVKPELSDESQIAPLAIIQKSIANLYSVLSQEIYTQTFTKFLISGVRMERDEQGNIKPLKWGSSNMLAIEDANVKIDRVAADSSQAESIRKSIKEQEMNLFRVAGMGQASYSIDGVSVSSGVALQKLQDDFLIIVDELARATQEAENQIIYIISEAESFEYLPSSYEVKIENPDEAADLANLRDILALDIPEVIKQKKIQEFVNTHFELTSEELTKLTGEMNEQENTREVESSEDTIGE